MHSLCSFRRATVALLLLSGASAHAQLVVTPSANATALAQALVGGAGIVVNSAAYDGDPAASGSFSGGSGILPFSSGILLTTGLAAGAVGPNNTGSYGNDNSRPGSATLSAISGQQTFDAATLTVRFTPVGNVVSFQYVFASEEYPEWVNQYNDVFGFFLNGQNIALVPGSNSPVSIDTINDVVPSNLAYYTDNTGGALNIQYDGLAGVRRNLFATGSVNPGVENTMVITIADSRDPILDSAVFLAARTFIDAPPPPEDTPLSPVPEPSTYALLGGLGLIGTIAWRRRRTTWPTLADPTMAPPPRQPRHCRGPGTPKTPCTVS